MKLSTLLKCGVLALTLTSVSLEAQARKAKKLDLRNAEKLVKTYNDLIEDMSETQRQTFKQNMTLILNYGETPSSDLTLENFQSARTETKKLNYLTRDSLAAQEFASETAIKGAKSLNKLTVNDVNTRGAEIEAEMIWNVTKAAQIRIDGYEAALTELEADKDFVTEKRAEALAKQAALVDETQAYNPIIRITSFSTGPIGQLMHVRMSLTNPLEEAFAKVSVTVRVDYGDYTSQSAQSISYGFEKAKPNATGMEKATLRFNPKLFENALGETLDRNHKFPEDAGRYKISMRPVSVATGSRYRRKETAYRLSLQDSVWIIAYPKIIQKCTGPIARVEGFIQAEKDRVALLRTDKLAQIKSDIKMERKVNPVCIPGRTR